VITSLLLLSLSAALAPEQRACELMTHFHMQSVHQVFVPDRKAACLLYSNVSRTS